MTDTEMRQIAFLAAASQSRADAGVQSLLWDAQACYDWLRYGRVPAVDTVAGASVIGMAG